MRSIAPLLLALPTLPLLPGCVVWDIRNEMRGVNAKLIEVKSNLDAANDGLTKANEGLTNANTRLDDVETGLKRLDRTNDLIGGVEQGMARIDRTNTSLDTLQKQLDLLASIEKSLGRLDAHLTAVRKTIGSINSMIPFLDLGGGAVEEPPPTADAASPRPADPADPAAPGTPPATAAPRDALAGIWIGRYPDDNTALLLLPEGRYIRSSIRNTTPPAVDAGAWRRDGNAITFTPDPPTPTPPTTTDPNRPAGPGTPPTPKPETFTLIQSTTRALALQADDGRILIFGRP